MQAEGQRDRGTAMKSRAFEQLAEAAETIVNPEVKKWHDDGGKVVGYFCTAMPTEMITAAGMLPFRVDRKSTRLNSVTQ